MFPVKGAGEVFFKSTSRGRHRPIAKAWTGSLTGNTFSASGSSSEPPWWVPAVSSLGWLHSVSPSLCVLLLLVNKYLGRLPGTGCVHKREGLRDYLCLPIYYGFLGDPENYLNLELPILSIFPFIPVKKSYEGHTEVTLNSSPCWCFEHSQRLAFKNMFCCYWEQHF